MSPASRSLAWGLTLVVLLGLVLFPKETKTTGTNSLVASWQRQVFDLYQYLHPRPADERPVVIVAIDDNSIATLGQWPWPRYRIAALLEKVTEAGAAAIGIDVLFDHADRLSPEQYAESLTEAPQALRNALRALPAHDPALSRALSASFSVLGVALENPPPKSERKTGLDTVGRVVQPTGLGVNELALERYTGATRSLPALESQAVSLAMINGAPEDGLIRRVPLLARLGDTLYTNLGLETLRVALTDTPLGIERSSLGRLTIQLGDRAIPISTSGHFWVYFATQREDHRVSAVDVLHGRLAPDTFKDKLVLLGIVAQGRLDRISTPLGDERPGVEVHAEVIESILNRQWLERPVWAPWLEFASYVVLAVGALCLGSSSQIALAVATTLGILVALPLLGFGCFVWLGWLLDFSLPGRAAALVFAATLARNLWLTQAARHELERSLQTERELQARIAGEMEAARRIQTGLLPRVEALGATPEAIDLAAHMEPARSVGGDLYDFFLLEPDTLFVTIGDVSGKGVPASLFMALSKATLRSQAQDHRRSLADALNAAQGLIQQDNPECMFVTVAALTISLSTGEYRYVNAGHEQPLVRTPTTTDWLPGESGPPLCVLDDFPFTEHSGLWPAGSLVVLVTDGVTEAVNPAGEFYGRLRLHAAVAGLVPGCTASEAVAQIRKDVLDFAAGTDLPDDMAIVALRVRP